MTEENILQKFCNCLAAVIATCGYVGKIPIMPGTFGSILAVPCIMVIIWLLAIFYPPYMLDLHDVLIIYTLVWVLILGLFLLGWWASSRHAARLELDDPGEIVIDELVGQLMVFAATFPIYFVVKDFPLGGILYVILNILLFRIYDIKKPWPINWLDDNVKGGIGIMLDDVLAAIFAIVTFYVIYYFCTDLIQAVNQSNT